MDASAEMLSVAAGPVGNERVRFIQADLFTWKPGRRYALVSSLGYGQSRVGLASDRRDSLAVYSVEKVPTVPTVGNHTSP